MPGEPVPYEAIVSEALERRHQEESARWQQAELAALAVRGRRVSERAWAAEIGCSAARVRQMCAAVAAFPSEESRFPLLSFEHHVVAAATSKPAEWLALCDENAWSAQDLRRAIRDGKPAERDAARITAEGEQLFHRLRQWAQSAPAPVRRELLGRVRAWLAGLGA